jgi:hypothetical protein
MRYEIWNGDDDVNTNLHFSSSIYNKAQIIGEVPKRELYTNSVKQNSYINFSVDKNFGR